MLHLHEFDVAVALILDGCCSSSLILMLHDFGWMLHEQSYDGGVVGTREVEGDVER